MDAYDAEADCVIKILAKVHQLVKASPLSHYRVCKVSHYFK